MVARGVAVAPPALRVMQAALQERARDYHRWHAA
jgi:hypothetical protein